jgi:phosphate transport system protein
MRARFADELAEIEQGLERELLGVAPVLELIAAEIVDCSDPGGREIAEAAQRLRGVARAVDVQLIELCARQAPVAGDLRLVLALMQLAQHGSLIANQFELIAEQLAELDPDGYDHQLTARQLSLMTDLAAQQVRHATEAFAARDPESAAELERQDDALDHINRQVFDATQDLDVDRRERELALRYVLIARSLERIGDNAVDIAEQAVFLVTAELLEFSDASRPKLRRSIG